MNQDKLTRALRDTQSFMPERLPDRVREALDHAYEQLPDIDLTPIRKRRRNRKLLKRASVSVAAVLVAGILLIGSGFISPSMANSLKQIPWINSLYEHFGDAGLVTAVRSGMVTDKPYSQTKAGRTVTISDLMYDGARLSVAVKVHEEGKLSEEELEAFEVDGRVNGEQGPLSYSIGNTQWIDESTAVRIINIGHSGYDARMDQAYEFPDAFEFTFSIAMSSGKEYKFVVPIEKNAPGAIELTKSEIKKYEGVTLQIDKLVITPATINLVALLGVTASSEVEPPARFYGNKFLQFALFDENGNEIKHVDLAGYYRVGEQDLFRGKQNFVGASTLPKSITIKPFARRIKGSDGKSENDYIQELEITMELPK